jgi:plastocyanin
MLLMFPSYSAPTLRSRISTPLFNNIGRLSLLILLCLLSPVSAGEAIAASLAEREKNNYYLPGKDQAQAVSVSAAGEAHAEVLVLTEAIAIKETGPKETIAKFGEVYGFAPSFIAVHKDEPTRLTFWNLQPDDDHDFMLADPDLNVMMHVKLKPLSKNSWVFNFHKEGVFPFYCAVHQPEMNGQILVLPARK